MTQLCDRSALDGHAAEQRDLFWRLGRDRQASPTHDRIHHAFEVWVGRTPSAAAVIHGRHELSYAELDRHANCLASLLRAHGVRVGDRVGVFLPGSVPMAVGILATLKVGAAYVPQDVRITPPARLRHVMDAAGIRLVLTLAEYAGRIPAGDRVVIPVDAIPFHSLKDDGSIRSSSTVDRDARTAVVVFTTDLAVLASGVAVTHAHLCNALLTEPRLLRIEPGMRVAQLLDIAHDLAVWEVLGALSHGATLVIRGREVETTMRAVDLVIATPSLK